MCFSYEYKILQVYLCHDGMSLQDGNTPLHIASAYGHEAVVEVLLKRGANHSTTNSVSTYFLKCIFDFLIFHLCVITGWLHTSTQSIS